VAKKGPAPRKRRTREHVIADLSLNHVERFILEEGHTAERRTSDYGYDLTVYTYDKNGYTEPGAIFVQVKGAEQLLASGNDVTFDIDVRDYALWTTELLPVILILFDVSRRRAYWLYVQRYFAETPSRKPKEDAKTVRVRVPKRQVLSRVAIRKMREYKQAIQEQAEGAVEHG
jgi:hypothetical protein